MKFAWYAYARYIITLALEEKIWSMTIAERGSDDQPIRFGIFISGENANIYERSDEVGYDKKTGRKRSFHYKPEDVVAVVTTNYIGQHMINQNCFVYSQR
jgi:hypothetical protein